eukprot:CAMPEP_0202910428 /NCGR_PEP_ID=MMETSP1392-20130828/52055_1 /ASSEMBLY_ACC=CAM_ASM_000868 /TAXON_ID=225041 /ORGANISM="Chlamydomonas chlamydogama, Strain SAG 11-48b" /LENGTH=64 /DNA_ID=CAMNT_0049600543 /DNA_START=66 /DNA_END=256 /DNA_ORIENTATION=-
MAGAFDVVSVGHRHIHLLSKEHQLQQVAKAHGLLVAETAHYMLQLKKEQVEAFTGKIVEKAEEG